MIYIDKSVIEQITKDGAEISLEVGYILIGLNPEKGHKPLTALALYEQKLGSAGSVDIGNTVPVIKKLVNTGLYDDLTTVGWAHTHPWNGGHKFFSQTDISTQTRFQNVLEDAIAIVGSKNGVAVYVMENGKHKQVDFEICDRRKEFPKLEEML